MMDCTVIAHSMPTAMEISTQEAFCCHRLVDAS